MYKNHIQNEALVSFRKVDSLNNLKDYNTKNLISLSVALDYLQVKLVFHPDRRSRSRKILWGTGNLRADHSVTQCIIWDKLFVSSELIFLSFKRSE